MSKFLDKVGFNFFTNRAKREFALITEVPTGYGVTRRLNVFIGSVGQSVDLNPYLTSAYGMTVSNTELIAELRSGFDDRILDSVSIPFNLLSAGGQFILKSGFLHSIGRPDPLCFMFVFSALQQRITVHTMDIVTPAVVYLYLRRWKY